MTGLLPNYLVRRAHGLARIVVAILEHPWFVPACFAVHIGLRAAILLVPIAPGDDASWYIDRAQAFANGDGYTIDGRPTAYYPVGWPLLLAGLFRISGPSVVAAQLANLALSAGSFLLVLAIARRVFRDELAARASVALIALYLNNAAFVSEVMTETYFAFLLLLAMFLLVAARSLVWAGVSGLVFGLAILTRTQALLIPGIALAVSYLAGTPARLVMRQAGVLGTVVVLVILPWADRNETAFGRWVLATNGGMNLLLGNNPSARGDFSADSLVDSVVFTTDDEGGSDVRAGELAMDWIRDNPSAFLALMPRKMFHLWIADGTAVWAYEKGFTHYDAYAEVFTFLRGLNQIYYAALLFGFLIAPLVWRRCGFGFFPGWTAFAYALAAYFSLISLVFFGDSRFHFPVMPFVAMHCGSVLALALRYVLHKADGGVASEVDAAASVSG